MGMPGSESALEELMSRVLGDMLMANKVAKLADDLYCGGNTPDELCANFKELISNLHRNALRLSPSKTIIAPVTTCILGWMWSQGRLSASKHIISTLTTCSRPDSISKLRSYIGSIKAIARVLPKAASYVAPLDDLVARHKPGDLLVWQEEDIAAFSKCQSALPSCQQISIPTPGEKLWLVTDAASSTQG